MSFCSSSQVSDKLADVALSSSPVGKGLFGKVALITGPTSGIGYETARVLAKHGATVILAARDSKKNETTKQKLIEALQKEMPHVEPHFILLSLDLSSLSSVRTAAQQFLALDVPLHFLVNNAGIMAVPYTFTEDGFESQLATNHLGHFYLTKLLLSKLRASATVSAPARIINVSSYAHNYSKFKTPDELEGAFHVSKAAYDPVTFYGHSKLCNVLFSRGLAEAQGKNHILCFSVHPGVVSTDLARNYTAAKIFYTVGAMFMKNSNQGASTTIHTLLNATKEQNGKYFADNAVKNTSSQAADDALKNKLMELSEMYIAEFEANHPSES